MPNHCTNYLQIKFQTGNQANDFASHFIEPYQCIEKQIVQKGKLGIIVTLTTAWRPDYEWLEKIFDTYEDCWIKNEWSEEGGTAGVWVAYTEHGDAIIKKMYWQDLSLEVQEHCFSP